MTSVSSLKVLGEKSYFCPFFVRKKSIIVMNFSKFFNEISKLFNGISENLNEISKFSIEISNVPGFSTFSMRGGSY